MADVVKEVKRLYGEEATSSLIYNLRREMREEGNGTLNHQTQESPEKADGPPLSEVETFFRVRAFVKEIGGLEKMREYLAMVERDMTQE